MAAELIRPNPDEMKEGETYKVVKEGDKWRLAKVEPSENKQGEEHITTIAGPQAAAILNALSWRLAQRWIDRSVPGLAVIELWQEKDD